MDFAPHDCIVSRDFFPNFSLLTQRKVGKRKGARAEAFLQLSLQNHSKQPKSGPRFPTFLTVAPPYASTSGGFPAPPEFGFLIIP
jgi:hypothetical protein